MNLKKYLEQQMNEKLKVNAFNNFENKKPHNTYYGPKEKGLIFVVLACVWWFPVGW